MKKQVCIIAFALSIQGCVSQPQQVMSQSTPECMQYRGIMTAPMPPWEIQKLEQKCKNSEELKK